MSSMKAFLSVGVQSKLAIQFSFNRYREIGCFSLYIYICIFLVLRAWREGLCDPCEKWAGQEEDDDDEAGYKEFEYGLCYWVAEEDRATTSDNDDASMGRDDRGREESKSRDSKRRNKG
ncbi:uncharacterized protein G2W53_002469 [Senna tora]|uniref:Uncharacterized protein n=1 Tax=Senna tora TaxID=362788 RepID=A0A835CKD4_9FABA|nr:uncharacterized protein G2W53_002469 [Senna tora]